MELPIIQEFLAPNKWQEKGEELVWKKEKEDGVIKMKIYHTSFVIIHFYWFCSFDNPVDISCCRTHG